MDNDHLTVGKATYLTEVNQPEIAMRDEENHDAPDSDEEERSN